MSGNRLLDDGVVFRRAFFSLLHLVVVGDAANTPGATMAILVLDSMNTGVVLTDGSRGERGATPPEERTNVVCVNFILFDVLFAVYNATVPAGSVNPTGTAVRTRDELRDGAEDAQVHFVFAPEFATCSSPD